MEMHVALVGGSEGKMMCGTDLETGGRELPLANEQCRYRPVDRGVSVLSFEPLSDRHTVEFFRIP